MAGFDLAISGDQRWLAPLSPGRATGQDVRTAYALHGPSWPRTRQVAPNPTIGLSLLAHGAALLALVLLVPSRIEPPAMPTEATVALLFEPTSTAPLSAPDAAPPTVLDTAPAPPEENRASAPTSEPTLPVVPQPPAPAPVQTMQPITPVPAARLPATPPRRPAVARPNSVPARPLASPAPPEAPSASVGPSPAASAPVVPPRPVAGMETNRAPTYPEIARRRGEQGRVMLRVSVSADGAPLDVQLAETSGHASLDAAALAAVRQWRFIPATQAGQPVPATAEVPVRFRLEN